MNFSPISFGSYSALGKVSFAGSKKPEGKENESKPQESKQNNSPDFKIKPEVYAGMIGMTMLNKMDATGAFDIPETIASESDYDETDTFEFDEDGMPLFNPMDCLRDAADSITDAERDEMARASADMMIQALQVTADFMGKVPDEMRGKIPVFITSTPGDFIRKMESDCIKNSEALAQQGGTFEIPDIEDIGDDDTPEETKEMAYSMLGFAQELMSDSSLVKSIFDSQLAAINVLKEEKFEEFSEAVEAINQGLNNMFNTVIMAGFDRDASKVISALTINETSTIEPKITDNGDGTSTYEYLSLGSRIEVVRNNANGDYISAEGTKDGEKQFSVEFRENGSIKNLYYRNPSDNSEIKLTQNLEKGTVKVLQTCMDNIVERTFEKQDDGTIKNSNFRFILNN